VFFFFFKHGYQIWLRHVWSFWYNFRNQGMSLRVVQITTKSRRIFVQPIREPISIHACVHTATCRAMYSDSGHMVKGNQATANQNLCLRIYIKRFTHW